ncbi:hypothetical protein C7N43_24160 [Sphingobacteriales bacterium UPWRP_1]|nr:hypothetical protein BVG80_13470 [Sphingobacteriales bacterium TSM_CSM]PSJ74402.1 hypothetical protein C7N43_24160 [Sphingobacteriales bacterium UPWRP_1]
MNISWGWRIAFAYCGFVVFMLFMVFLCMRQDVDLVAENYYEQELNYEQQIQKQKNAQRLEQNVQLQYQTGNNQITVRYPKTAEPAKGTIAFFRPSDKTLDFSIPVQPDTGGIQIIDAAQLKNGLWRIKMEWSVGKTPYYTEKTIFKE